MPLARLIDELPDDERLYYQAPLSYMATDIITDKLKRAFKVLRKCETALDVLPSDALGIGGDGNSVSRWSVRDELLGEIREVLG